MRVSKASRVALALLLTTGGMTVVAPTAQAVTYVNTYLLIQWQGEGCVGSGTGTSISLVARDMWQALGTVTKSWPPAIAATRCEGDSQNGLIQVGPVSLIQYDGYHNYRLEASITDASGTVTVFSVKQDMRIQFCNPCYMGTNGVYNSGTQPASNHLGVKNGIPSNPTISSLYPDYPDYAHSLYLYWTGPSSIPLDFNLWEVHMSKQSGFTPSYSFPTTLKATRTWGTNYLSVTGLESGTQYCFKVRNTDRFWKYSDITYRNYPSYGESAERCANTQSETLRVTSPNGGEIWSGVHPITWVGGAPNFEVQVSKDSGSTFTSQATGIAPRTWSWDTRAWPDGATYRVRASDGSGNDISDADFTVDNTPPVSTIVVEGEQCNGWYSAPPTITLSATDNLAGVRNTYWAADAGATTTYAGPFQLTGDGDRNLTYWSDDRADAPNVEARKSERVRIDTLPPVTALQVGVPKYQGDRLYVNSSTLLTLDATDAGSGVNKTEYRINGGAWTDYTASFTLTGPDGEYTLGFRSADNACHTEDESTQLVFLDNTHPDLKIAKPAPGSVTNDGQELFPGLGAVFDLLDQVLGTLPDLPVGADNVCDIARIVAQGLSDAGAGAVGDLLVSLVCQHVDPDAPAVVYGKVTVVGEAQDPVVNGGASGMDRVEFFVDGVLRSTDPGDPYAWEWDTTQEAPGMHTLRLVAYDHLGQDTAKERKVVVVSTKVQVDVCGLLDGLPLPQFLKDLILYVLNLLGVPCILELPALPTIPPQLPALPPVP